MRLPVRAAPPEPAPKDATVHASRPFHVPVGAWVLGGVSLLGFGGFAVFYSQAVNDYSTLQTTCSPNCKDSDLGPLRTHAGASYVSLGVGIAALAGAVTWTLVARSAKGSDPDASAVAVAVRPVAGGALVGIGARF